MRRRCSILVFCILLGLGVSLTVPAEDVPETGYDESEALPYECTPLFSSVVPLAATRTTQAALSFLHHKFGVAPLFIRARARVRDNEAEVATDTRISLALLCTLLC